MLNKTIAATQQQNHDARRRLVAQIKACPPHEGAALLMLEEPTLAFEALADLNPPLPKTF